MSEKATQQYRLVFTAKGAKTLLNFLSMQDFTHFHLNLEDEEAPSDILPCPTNNPPWLILEADFNYISYLHRRMIKAIRAIKQDANTPQDVQDRNTITRFGYAVVSNIIMLIQMLLICYNYYHVKSEKYPDTKPSILFDRELSPDLYFAMLMSTALSLEKYEKHFDLIASLQREIYKAMNMLLTLLEGWFREDQGDDQEHDIPEVAELRDAFLRYHTSHGDGKFLEDLNVKFQAISTRFAKKEPKWELAKHKASNTTQHPLIPGAEAFQQMGSALSPTKKKKPKNGRIGCGLKGFKTPIMDQQLVDFGNWIKNGHPINELDKEMTIGARANLYWGSHKSMERAAKASGNKKGYKNPSCLGGAYRNQIPSK